MVKNDKARVREGCCKRTWPNSYANVKFFLERGIFSFIKIQGIRFLLEVAVNSEAYA